MPPLDPEPNDEEKEEQLDEDYDPPFSLPSDSHPFQAADPQSLDPNLEDQQELYDEGIGGIEPESTPVDPEEEGFDIEPNADEV
jgi:hypothetical protein